MAQVRSPTTVGDGDDVMVEVEKFFEDIRNRIEDAMEQGDNENTKFVTRHSLEEIWSTARLKQFCRIANLEELSYDKAIGRLTKDLLQIISILVRISWAKWEKFDRIFFNSRWSADGVLRVDSNIERFKLQDLAKDNFLGSKASARDFISMRYAFIPITIEEGTVKSYEPRLRLPFTEPGDRMVELGVGSYGRVTKATIAKWQYRRGKDPVPNTYIVARKVLKTMDGFQEEARTLVLLRKSLLKHDHVASFLAIISIGSESNILYELAVMDLQAFLEGGRHSEFQFEPSSLIKQMTGIASALDFLHNRISIPRNQNSVKGSSDHEGILSCFHMDLKPDNILVYLDTQYDAGLWKIHDFGISSIKEAVEPKPKSEQNGNWNTFLAVPTALGDLKRSMTSKTNHTSAKRPSGTWQAPEVHKGSGKNIGSESDIWSFGCIFVLACALYFGANDLEALEAIRGKTKGGDNYDANEGDCFYRTIDGVVELNPHVKTWIESLSQKSNQDPVFLHNCKRIILSALTISRDSRIKAEALHRELDRIWSPQQGVTGGSSARTIMPQPKSTLIAEPSNPANTSTNTSINTSTNLINTGPSSRGLAVNVEQNDNDNHFAELNQNGSPETPSLQISPPQPSCPHHQNEGLVSEGHQSRHLITNGAQSEINPHYPGRPTCKLPVISNELLPNFFDSHLIPSEGSALSAATPNLEAKGKEKEVQYQSQVPSIGDLEINSADDISDDDCLSGELSGLAIPDSFNLERPGSSKLRGTLRLQESFKAAAGKSILRTESLPITTMVSVSDALGDIDVNVEPSTMPETDLPVKKYSSSGKFASRTDEVVSLVRTPTKSTSFKATPNTYPRRTQTAPGHPSTPRSRPIIFYNPKSAPANFRPSFSPISERDLAIHRPTGSNSRMNSLMSSHSNLSMPLTTLSRMSSLNGTIEPTTIPLYVPNPWSIIQAMMSSTCQVVAFLSPDVISVYSISGELHPKFEAPPPAGTKWVSMSMSGCWILARGLSKGRTIFQIHEILDSSPGIIDISSRKESPSNLLEDGSISCHGYVLYQDQTSVWLSHKDQPKSVPPRQLLVDGKIKRSWFNISGEWAFAWYVKNGNDHIKAWNVSDPSQEGICDHLIPDHENHGEPVKAVLSFPSALGCLFWKSHDNVLIVPEETTEKFREISHPFKGLKAVGITPGQDKFIYIQQKRKGFFSSSTRLYIREIKFDRDGNVEYGPPEKVQLRFPFEQDSALSISSHDGQGISCFIAHPRAGVVERVIFPERAFLDTLV